MFVNQGGKILSRVGRFFRKRSVFAILLLSFGGGLLPGAGVYGASQDPSLGALERKAEAGDLPAMVRLGMRLDYGQKGASRDLGKAIFWYRKAALGGDPSAMMLLSQRYEIGRGVPQDDTRALKWLVRSARKGYPPAEDALGDRYAAGQGVPKDDRKAVRWYFLAGSHGYGESQDLLGQRYETGQGVPKNLGKAVMWYLRAAKDSGNADAFARLGYFSEKGLGGLKKSPREAWFWYSLAKGTDLSARKALDRLGRRLSEAEKTWAWKKKTEFLARYRSRWNRWILRP